MALLTIQDLLTPSTPDNVFNNMVTALVTMGVPADKWRKGGTASTILRVVATIYASFTQLMVQAVGSGFLNTAAGGWLTLLAFYVYGVTRIAATFATGSVVLTNNGGGIYSFPVGGASFQDSSTGQTYTNLDPINLPAGPGAQQTIRVQCTVAGAIGSAAPGAIDTIVTSMLGVVVTNPFSVVGLDQQSDPDLRTTCFNKLGAMSVRGPRTAYAYAVSQAVHADGSPVNVNRVSVSAASHVGDVTVIVASPTGIVSGPDLALISASIEAIARPDAVTVILSSATTVAYTPTLTVWGQALPGLTTSAVHDAVAAALTAFIAAYPIGGFTKSGGPEGLFASGIDGVAKAAHPAVFAIDGATDLVLAAAQVATDGITVNVNLV